MRKLSPQKIFCFVSFIFILCCCIFYGYRFISLYIENNKTEKVTSNALATKIKDNNFGKEYFKNINSEYYFYENEIDNNYVTYSNMLWRIIKINNDDSITLVLDDSITSLAYGIDVEDYDHSMINYWLNKIDNEDNTGILNNLLNNKETYLNKVNVCTDEVTEINSNTTCTNSNNEYYLGLLSTIDYINTGNTNSFLINGQNYYLSNTDDKSNVWYLTDEGKLKTDDGTNILGVRPVINVKAFVEYISGEGTKDNPYTFEKETSLFGGYVKLDNDIWRIYDVNDEIVRLVLNRTLEDTYKYSSYSSYFNDTTNGNASYYINNTFLNSLSYKDIIKYTTWSNGYYSESNNFDYRKTLSTTIETKVCFASIGNVMFNSDDAWTTTGLSSSGGTIYTTKDNSKMYSKKVSNKANLIPTIAIDKNILVKGKGTLNEPYETE